MRGLLTARLLAAARIQDGENVLDVGCGCGDATILAARATRRGHALGADISQIQVAEARRLAAAAGVTNASPGGVVMPGAAWLVTAHAV
jgi:cyclopropane fatty-acyl-phospholipid synthase-like methyltransferase